MEIAQPSFRNKKRTLGVFSVVLIVYFNVCGGPIGSETIFSSCGPLVGLISLFVFPLVWCLQTSLVTLELSSAFPENGGYSLWVKSAFGTFWGVQESYYSWISGVIDNAIYPGLIFDNAKHLLVFFNNATLAGESSFWDNYDDESDDASVFLPNLQNSEGRFDLAIRVALCVIMVIPNFFCLKGFGSLLVVLGSLAILPFIAFCLMGAKNVDASNLVEYNITTDGFNDLLQVVFWNMNGFDCISTSSGEVRNPGRSIGFGLLIAFGLMLFTYLLPLLVSAGINRPSWQDGWDDGYYTIFAVEIGGIWLAGFIVIATIMGGVGNYITEMFEDSFQILGMAEDKMAPRIFSYRHKRCRTPISAILLNLVVIILLQPFNVSTIITYTNAINCASILLELAACISLRIRQPDLPRPFKIPLNTLQLAFFLLPPFIVASYMIVTGLIGPWPLATTQLAVLAFGVVPYALLVWSQKRNGEAVDAPNSSNYNILCEEVDTEYFAANEGTFKAHTKKLIPPTN